MVVWLVFGSTMVASVVFLFFKGAFRALRDLDFLDTRARGDELVEHPDGGLTGSHDGVHVRVCLVTRGTGKQEGTYCRVEARPTHPLPDDLTLYSESGLFSILKMVGMQDIEVGDPELDDNAMIRGANAAHVRHLLHSSERLRLACKLLVTEAELGGVYEGLVHMESSTLEVGVVAWHRRCVVEACKAFDDAILYPWQRFTADEHLNLSVEGQHVEAWAVAADGTRATIHGDLRTGRTSYRITPPVPWGRDLRVVAGPDAAAVDEPPLDRLVAISGLPAPAIQFLCESEEVRRSLAEVFTLLPESRIDAGVVEVVASTGSFALSEQFSAALQLTNALVKRWQSLPSENAWSAG